MKKQEFKIEYDFNIGNKVVKKSGNPFKSTFKVGTIREFVVNPYSGKDAVVIDEDGSVVDKFMLKTLC